MRVLVTGGAGFIGSHLTDWLLSEGYEVVVFDDFSTGTLTNLQAALEHPQCSIVEGSVADPVSVKSLGTDFDLIFHLAATVGLFNVLEQRLNTIETNTAGTANILKLASKRSTPTVVFSTSEVYGKSTKAQLSEDDDLILGRSSIGRWSYAVSKLMDEHLALAYHDECNVPALVIRPFNIVGPRQAGAYGMVLPRFAGQALKGEPITVFGDGSQVRTFCHVADFIDAVYRLSQNAENFGQVFNVGSEEAVSIKELASLVTELAESQSRVTFVDYADAYRGDQFEEIYYRRPSCEKLRMHIRFQPKYGLVETIQDIIGHLRTSA